MIESGLCLSARREFFQGEHKPTDTYMMALFTDDAELSVYTESYSPQGEVAGKGYQPGGIQLTGYAITVLGTAVTLGWDSPSWKNASITARGALIYNRTRGGCAVCVLRFEELTTSTNGKFVVPMPSDGGVVRWY